ncbi:MAG: sn-glycerol-1-phosphate dehydrogenase [Candidatus Marinimicrobia bacterium]|nr:sn-glycerol-1-phosphate dehydrogenase [Candidatus Neomarinimicrobiota bacterium]
METFEKESRKRLEIALSKADTTRYINVGHNTISSVGEYFIKCFPARRAVIVADQNTFQAAGQAAQKVMKAQDNQTLEPFIFNESDFHAEMQYVEELTAYLKTVDAIPIAVGSGTLNDLTKLAAHRCGRPYMVVVTAASVDGYTAFGASITAAGFKQTFQCSAPLCVIADLSVIAEAPPEMNAWGYADLIAKIPAGADWILADALGIEAIRQDAWALVQHPLRDLTADPGGVKRGEGKALCYLVEGLLMAGLAMQAIGSSRPASGAEHQFSHLWDIEHHTHHGIAPSHGFKVAIGSLSSLALYEKILDIPIEDQKWELITIKERWLTFAEIEANIVSHFNDPDVAKQVIDQAQGKYVSPDVLHDRMRQLSDLWPELKPQIIKQILPFSELRDKLVEINGPVDPQDIGIEISRLRHSFRLAQYIRTRYTILDVALEGGWLESSVHQIFSNNQYWAASQEEITLSLEGVE